MALKQLDADQKAIIERKIWDVQRHKPFGRIGPRRTITLPLDRIQPQIRLAHRLTGSFHDAERILFDHELVLLLAGQATFRINNATHEVRPRTLLFIPPFAPHRLVSDPLIESQHIAIHFDFAPGVPPYDETLGDRPPYRVRLTHSMAIPTLLQVPPGDRIEHALTEIVREFSGEDVTGQLMAEALLMEVFARLLRMASGGGESVSARNQERVAIVVRAIHSNVRTPPGVDEMAALAGLSVSRLYALFKATMGTSPHDYVMRARVEEARRLLASPTLSIKEVAARSGFDDVYHFSRVFRRIDGLTPTQFREAVLRGAE